MSEYSVVYLFSYSSHHHPPPKWGADPLSCLFWNFPILQGFVVNLGVGLEVVSNIVNGWFILGVSYLRMSVTFSRLKDNLASNKILGLQHFHLRYVQLLLCGVFYCLVFKTWWVSWFFVFVCLFFLSALPVKKFGQFF